MAAMITPTASAASLSGEDTRVYEVINEQYLEKHGHCATHPVTGLGSGDSMLFLDVLPPDLLEEAFDTMNSEIDWNIMNHKGTIVIQSTYICIISIHNGHDFNFSCA